MPMHQQYRARARRTDCPIHGGVGSRLRCTGKGCGPAVSSVSSKRASARLPKHEYSKSRKTITSASVSEAYIVAPFCHQKIS